MNGTIHLQFFFFFFSLLFLLLVCLCFLFPFFFSFLPARCSVFLFSFFFCSFRVSLFLFLSFFVAGLFLFFFFLLLSIPAFFFVLFIDIVLWCFKLSFTVTRFVLSPWRTRLARAPNRGMLYCNLQHHNDTIIKTQEDFFINTCTSHFIVRVWKGLLEVFVWEGVGDRTETAIFWPHSYGRQRWVFLVLLMLNLGPSSLLDDGFLYCILSTTSLGPNSIGGPNGPFGLAWLSLPHLVYNSVRSPTASNCNSSGAPRAPSAWCGFPYHISSITPSDL